LFKFPFDKVGKHLIKEHNASLNGHCLTPKINNQGKQEKLIIVYGGCEGKTHIGGWGGEGGDSLKSS